MGITLGIIGFGEVGGIFGRGLLGKAGVDAVYAWDLKFADTATGEHARAAADADGIRSVEGMAALCAQATLLVSAVTASSTLAAAEEAASMRVRTHFSSTSTRPRREPSSAQRRCFRPRAWNMSRPG